MVTFKVLEFVQKTGNTMECVCQMGSLRCDGEAMRNSANALLSSELLALPASLLHTLRNNANRLHIQVNKDDTSFVKRLCS